MLYVFQTEIIGWKNSELQAIPTAPLSDYKSWWWQKESFRNPPSLPHFLLNPKAPELDVYFTRLLVLDLFSARLINILRKMQVNFESFPVIILDRKTKQILPHTYEAPHLLEILPVLDSSKSVIGKRIEKLVLVEEANNINSPMFRVENLEQIVLINEALMLELTKAGITGYRCYPVSEYQTL